jgi:hypothetical protein
VSDLTDSRAATDALLGTLRDGRWRPYAVARFLWLAADRSVRQAARRPRALTQLTVLHGLLFVLARDRDPGRGWVAAGWLLGALHLGLLERRDRLAPADALTLTRGSLPATALGSCRWSGVMAIGLDLADGRLARRQETVSPFGDYADSLADIDRRLTELRQTRTALRALAERAAATDPAECTDADICRILAGTNCERHY